MFDVIIILISVLTTSFLSGIFGMAGGMILMGIFGVLLTVELAMFLHGTAQLTANGSRAIALFKNISWKACGFYLIGALISAAFMWNIQYIPSKAVMFILLGLMPFVTLIKALPVLRFENNSHAVLCGLVVTAAHLTAGVSGPLLDIFFVRSLKTRFEVIATKAITQSLGHFMKLLYFGTIAANFEVSSLLIGAVVVAAITGTLLGGAVLRRMNDENFRLYSRRIIIAIGSIYIAHGLSLLL